MSVVRAPKMAREEKFLWHFRRMLDQGKPPRQAVAAAGSCLLPRVPLAEALPILKGAGISLPASACSPTGEKTIQARARARYLRHIANGLSSNLAVGRLCSSMEVGADQVRAWLAMEGIVLEKPIARKTSKMAQNERILHYYEARRKVRPSPWGAVVYTARKVGVSEALVESVLLGHGISLPLDRDPAKPVAKPKPKPAPKAPKPSPVVIRAEYHDDAPVSFDDNGRSKLASMPGYGLPGKFVPMPELMRGVDLG